MGFVVPALFVDQYDHRQTYSNEELVSFRQQVVTMFVWVSFWSSAISLLVLMTF
jgi:hypothetical protein